MSAENAVAAAVAVARARARARALAIAKASSRFSFLSPSPCLALSFCPQKAPNQHEERARVEAYGSQVRYVCVCLCVCEYLEAVVVSSGGVEQKESAKGERGGSGKEKATTRSLATKMQLSQAETRLFAAAALKPQLL